METTQQVSPEAEQFYAANIRALTDEKLIADATNEKFSKLLRALINVELRIRLKQTA